MFDLRRTFLWVAALSLLAALSLPAQQRKDGFIDTNFFASCFNDPNASTSARALAVQFDGKIIAGGNFRAPQNSCVNALARLLPNGALDTSFQSPFVLAGDVVNAVTFQGNRLLVAGSMRDASGTFPIARLNANGTFDGTFARPSGMGNWVFHSLLVLPDTRILAVGDFFQDIPTQPFGGIALFKANGQLEASSLLTPRIATSPAFATLISAPGGKFLIGGAFDTISGTNRPGIARLNGNFSLDGTFVPAITAGEVRAIVIQPDGQILVAGNFTVNGFMHRALVRLNSNGTLDNSFQPLNGGGTIGQSLLLQPDGKVVLGHSFGVMRLNTNGALDTTFGPLNAFQQLGTEADNVTALALTANSNLVIGVQRVAANGVERRGVARLFGMIPPLPPPPVIVVQPVTRFVDAGANVTFSVTATGAPPVTFQWRKNGANIKGATNNVLEFTNVNSTHTGNYTVLVSNPGGSVTSAVARLSVTFFTDTVTLHTNGVGAILPALAGKPLEIGRSYTITARPAVGNLFSNWTGGVTSSSPVLTFVMQSNLTIVANFVPSPFTAVRGLYNGLFYNTATPRHLDAGALTLTLDEKGGVRGKVRMGTVTRAFKAAFSLERVANISLPGVGAAPPLSLVLELDLDAVTITGTASISTNASSSVFAYRNPFTTANPTPAAGFYNTILPGEGSSAVLPGGDSLLPLTVTAAGRVSGKGTLADGTMFNVVSAISPDGHVPLYVPLYGGRGSIFGWLTVDPTASNHVFGNVWWVKPANAGPIYPLGFNFEIPDVLGSRYVTVGRGTPVLDLGDGVLIVSGGGLTEPWTNSIALGGDNKIVGDNQLTLTISPTKGTANGSFIHPGDGKKRTIKALVLPQQNVLRGFFPSGNQSGRVFVGEAPQP